MAQEQELEMAKLIADYPLFKLALPLRCRCGNVQAWEAHRAAYQAKAVVVSLRGPCTCGEDIPCIQLQLTRGQRRRVSRDSMERLGGL